MTPTSRSYSPYSFLVTASKTWSASRAGSGEAHAATAPRSRQAWRKTSPTSPRLPSTRSCTGPASPMKRHSSSSARSGRSPPYLVEDEPALLVEVPHEGRALLPVDEGAGLPQRGEPLADVGGDRLGAGLGAELEPQPPLGRGVPGGELEQELGEPLGAEGLEV